jgi:hypothetical protein
MPDLVTLTQGKRQLNIEAARTDLDSHIEILISAASAMVMTHIKRDDLTEWEDEDSSPPTYTVPKDIIAACLIALGYLFQQREGAEPVPEAFYSLLEGWRDPTIA